MIAFLPSSISHFLPICCLMVAVAGCSQSLKNHMNDPTPEMLAEAIGDFEVDGVQASVLKSAKRATEQGEHHRAAQFYKQLMAETKANQKEKSFYHLAYAESLRRSGEYAAALKEYEAFIKDNPESLVAHEGRGLTLLAQGDITRALEALSAVMKRDRTRWRAINGIGVALSTEKKTEEALRYFREALKYSEKNPSILNNIGLTLAIMEDYPRAVKALQMAARYHDSDDVIRKQLDLNLAMVHGISGDLTAAEKLASRHLEKAELYNNLGYYAYLANDKALAKSYLNMALTQSPAYYKRAWDNLQHVMKGER